MKGGTARIIKATETNEQQRATSAGRNNLPV